jgi:hypothetical protein
MPRRGLEKPAAEVQGAAIGTIPTEVTNTSD